MQLLLHDEHPANTAWQHLISAEEMARASNMGSPARAHTFCSARAYLREHLGRTLDVAPTKVPLVIHENGKPLLAETPAAASFSISHSNSKILIGLMEGHFHVGVDLQYMSDDVDIAAIAARYFNDSDKAELAPTPATEQRLKAFEIWCKKEALFKIGLQHTPIAMHTENLGNGFVLAAGYALAT